MRLFERLVARDSKGELGQYFTPRDIVRLCVSALNPHPRDRIIDPACGSGAFLFEAVRYAHDRYDKAPACLGIDFGARSIKVAYLLSNAICPGAIKVSKANSIDGRAYSHAHPTEWNSFISERQSAAWVSRGSWGAWNNLSCSLLLTNPPFAGEVDEPAVLSSYESQKVSGSNRKGSVGREHLFLERAIQMLKPGGRLAIVLPQGLLANPTSSYLRRWILTKCRLLAVVGLHPHAFVPYTGVKTSLLFLERLQGNRDVPQDYPVLFVASKQPGKDSSGRRSGESDYPQVAAALSRFFFSEGLAWAAKPAGTSDHTAETVSIREIVEHDRFDAEYYDHEIRRLHFDVAAKASGVIGDCVARSVERFKRDMGEIDYVDISSVDSKTGTVVPTRINAADAPSRASYLVMPGDVLVSTVRPDRNTVALVSSSRSVPLVASNGFCVLRPNGVPAEVLYAYCRTEAFRKLLSRHATASMYPAVTDRDVLAMPFVKPPAAVSSAVTKEVREGLGMLDVAKNHVSRAIKLMDDFAGAQTTAPVQKSLAHPHNDPLASTAREPEANYRSKNRVGRANRSKVSLASPSLRRQGKPKPNKLRAQLV